MIILPFCLSACFREELKLPFTTMEPVVMDDGWDIAAPEDEGMDAAALQRVFVRFHEEEELWQVRSLLVVRHGRLVAETYTKDTAERCLPVPVWSCTKQVMGLLAGIALDAGYITSLNDVLQTYLPAYAETCPDKMSLRLDNLLTMRSGIGYSNEGFNGHTNQLMRELPERSLDFVLALPLVSGQGTCFRYNDGDPHILSAVLQQTVGMPVGQWAQRVLFDRIGLPSVSWIAYKDGLTMGAFGLSLTPRDLARIGLVVASGGQWQGQPVVSEEWIRRMTSAWVDASAVDYTGLSFGYFWWIDTEREVVLMDGKGGQYVFIDRNNGLLVVITSDPNDAQGLSYAAAAAVYDAVLASCH